ncbi:MAG TPA: TIGR04283 family arsenosugar biosynthesis glycosyltransferase [Thermoanaerobaculia bacterium]|nr:TIGR04283 family arsenosugar biosynthesis glycosyltransferase [Thermoanaerobaculia bacterium]
MKITIVMPTLNEAATLERPLAAALAAADEVVVSDGGSTDGTPEIARRLGARVVSGPPGRGGQLTRGAQSSVLGSRGDPTDVLLFLHADTFLPPEAAQAVRAAIAAGAVGGAFRVRFDVDRPLLRLGARLINLRTRWTGLPLGDQAQFVRRDVFERLAGFRDWPILEDLDLAMRLKREGRTVLLGGCVTTAARRFVNLGIVRTVATNWLIWSLFALGVSPHRLVRLYYRLR